MATPSMAFPAMSEHGGLVSHGSDQEASPSLSAKTRTAWRPASDLENWTRGLLYLLPVLFVIGRAPADAAMSLIAVLFLIRSWSGQGWRWLRTPWVVAAVVFWLYLLLVSGLALSPPDSFSRAVPFIRFVLFAAALQHWLLIDRQHVRMLLTSLAVVVGFVAFDCLYQYVVGRDLFDKAAEGAFRLSGPFDNDVAGTFIAKTSLPLIGWWFAWSALKGRFSWMIGALLAMTIGGVVMLTGERTALATFGLGTFLLVSSIRALRWQLLGIGLLAIVGAASLVASDPDLKERFVGHTLADVDDFWAGRYGIIFVKAFKAWQEEPLTGVGLKNFRLTCDVPNFEHRGPVETWCFTHPHNPYMELLSETGVLGLAGFLLLLGLIGRDLVSAWRADRPDQPLTIGASASLVLFFWPIMVSKSIFSNWNAMLLWLMIGLALALARPRPDRRSAADRPT